MCQSSSCYDLNFKLNFKDRRYWQNFLKFTDVITIIVNLKDSESCEMTWAVRVTPGRAVRVGHRDARGL